MNAPPKSARDFGTPAMEGANMTNARSSVRIERRLDWSRLRVNLGVSGSPARLTLPYSRAPSTLRQGISAQEVVHISKRQLQNRGRSQLSFSQRGVELKQLATRQLSTETERRRRGLPPFLHLWPRWSLKDQPEAHYRQALRLKARNKPGPGFSRKAIRPR
jgi:hypothetical protein